MRSALLLAALAASPCFAAGPLSDAARLSLAGETLKVGAAEPAANARLSCEASAAQHTIRRCKLAAGDALLASCLGRRIDGATLNLHFQGKVLNMSVEFASGNDPDAVLNQLKAVIGSEPKVQYWADDAHLFASSIWVDGESEIELTKTVRGPAGDGKTRLFVSTLLGGLPLSPEDAP